jgi:hypothetical protein
MSDSDIREAARRAKEERRRRLVAQLAGKKSDLQEDPVTPHGDEALVGGELPHKKRSLIIRRRQQQEESDSVDDTWGTSSDEAEDGAVRAQDNSDDDDDEDDNEEEDEPQEKNESGGWVADEGKRTKAKATAGASGGLLRISKSKVEDGKVVEASPPETVDAGAVPPDVTTDPDPAEAEKGAKRANKDNKEKSKKKEKKSKGKKLSRSGETKDDLEPVAPPPVVVQPLPLSALVGSSALMSPPLSDSDRKAKKAHKKHHKHHSTDSAAVVKEVDNADDDGDKGTTKKKKKKKTKTTKDAAGPGSLSLSNSPASSPPVVARTTRPMSAYAALPSALSPASSPPSSLPPSRSSSRPSSAYGCGSPLAALSSSAVLSLSAAELAASSTMLPPLTDDCAVAILRYLRPGELCRAALVAKSWHRLAAEDSLWAGFLTEKMRARRDPTLGGWKQYYKLACTVLPLYSTCATRTTAHTHTGTAARAHMHHAHMYELICVWGWRWALGRRSKVATEMLTTEQSYVGSLRRVVELFIVPLRDKGNEQVITAEERKALFSEIEARRPCPLSSDAPALCCGRAPHGHGSRNRRQQSALAQCSSNGGSRWSR